MGGLPAPVRCRRDPSHPPRPPLAAGKTLLARAVAHHTDCTFIRVSGAELVQKYIGEGARMVRELFVMAREAAPTIIFMDEVDSIGACASGGAELVRQSRRRIPHPALLLQALHAQRAPRAVTARCSAR